MSGLTLQHPVSGPTASRQYLGSYLRITEAARAPLRWRAQAEGGGHYSRLRNFPPGPCAGLPGFAFCAASLHPHLQSAHLYSWQGTPPTVAGAEETRPEPQLGQA